jgi:DNA-binding MarR family transcriptional regulator
MMPKSAAEPTEHSPFVTNYDKCPSYFLNLISNQINIKAGRLLRREFGLSTTEWRIIGLAGAEPGASQQRAMEVSAVDRSVVSRGIQGLAKRNLIDVRIDPADARRLQLFLTPAGQVIHDRGVALTWVGDEALLRGFSAEEREVLIASFHRLIANIPSMEFIDGTAK